jgi:transposase-like protein
MVKIIQREEEKLYQCESCGFHYRVQEQASACETWCHAHKTCSMEITKDSVEKESI